MKIQFVRSKELILSTHAGLATVGALLAHTGLRKRLNHTKIKHEIGKYRCQKVKDPRRDRFFQSQKAANFFAK